MYLENQITQMYVKNLLSLITQYPAIHQQPQYGIQVISLFIKKNNNWEHSVCTISLNFSSAKHGLGKMIINMD